MLSVGLSVAKTQEQILQVGVLENGEVSWSGDVSYPPPHKWGPRVPNGDSFALNRLLYGVKIQI